MKWSQRKRTALVQSINDWVKVSHDTSFFDEKRKCPLCVLYSDNMCNGCPIRIVHNGTVECYDTSFYAFRRELRFGEQVHTATDYADCMVSELIEVLVSGC